MNVASPGATALAVVTGSSSGIGRQVAILLARRGFRLILVARRLDRLNRLVADLGPAANARAMVVDLADANATAAAADQLASEATVDVLVNVAGFGVCVPFLEHAGSLDRRLMQVHYFAPAALIRAILPGMLARRSGQIINVASIATKVGPWGHGAYAASKSALVAMTQSLASEHIESGVHFSYVNPGIVQTEFFDHESFASMAATVKRRGISSTAAARRIVSLLDHPRLELCIPRHYRVLDWLYALSPSWAHRLVARSSRPAGREATVASRKSKVASRGVRQS